jgi:hypothetical protein
VNRGDHSDKEIEPYAIARLEPLRQRLGAYACDARLTVRLVGERVYDVVRELAVDADRLQALENGFA